MSAFSFVQISDHHLYASEDRLRQGLSPAVRFHAVLQRIAERHAGQVDFIVSTGDLVEDPTREAYKTLSRTLGLDAGEARPPGPLQITVDGLREFPLYVLPGNHDDPRLLQEVLFPGAPVAPSYNFGFHHGGVQFLCLDWGIASRAEIKPETLAFLEKRLPSGEPTVILQHHLFVPVGVSWLDRLLPTGVDGFWSVVEGKNVLGILAGHVHLAHEVTVHDTPVSSVGATAFSFARTEQPLLGLESPQYRYLTVHEGVLTSRLFDVPMT